MEPALLRVVLAGGTGHFGSRVARALLARPDVNLRLLVPPGTEESVLGDLADRGATVVEAELSDDGALDAALEGAHAVVSAVGASPMLLVAGQLHLLKAAQRQGVRRFIPSGYALNASALEDGEGASAEERLRVAETVARSGVGHTFVRVGSFMEVTLSPMAGLFDFHARRAYRWGSGEELFDVTSMEDAAHLLATVVDDPRAHNRRLEFSGDVVSFNGVVALYEEVTDKRLEVVDMGTLKELKARVLHGRDVGPPGLPRAAGPALLALLSGEARLHDAANSAYPQLTCVRVRDYLAHHFGANAPLEQASA
ncbi:MAG: NmrA family NAD(P)-binding protein [Myxococcaceae bacterium]|nr:NmrA family NAD(P)-binding protein [Myxococcaceae bacterium]